MTSVFILFPNQLFKDIKLLNNVDEVYLVEEFLFFNQFKFHKQKLVLHRASMKYYENYLRENGIKVNYIDAISKNNDIRILLSDLKNKNISGIEYYDVCDNWLEKRIVSACKINGLKRKEHQSPLFINNKSDIESYFGKKEKYFQTDFYKLQRKKFEILIDEKENPIGGKWTFDAENRLKYPSGKKAPEVKFPSKNTYHKEAIEYIGKNYSGNYGNISDNFVYPSTHKESEEWLQKFFESRFKEFGDYEDAIISNENILHHSVLTPILNIGLILPMQIVNSAIDFANKNKVSLNSLEGFIRQIIGWREFIRGVYVYKGTQERTTNFWNFNRNIPSSFYTASTGVEPIDITIKKLLSTGYNHHIERLMLLGNFMLLCEIHPYKVYQWFMEMYIDSYDWVMVPNIYGMSQFADGGIMATKPYISGSNYVLKMSNYTKGNWCSVWDALFWQFLNKRRAFFTSNPRLGMLVKTYDKMSEEKKSGYIEISNNFLNNLQ